jgi:YHYH protein
MAKKSLIAAVAASALLAIAVVKYWPDPARTQVGEPANTKEAVANAKWADTVTITFDDADMTFRFQSNGIPSHGFAEKYLIPKDVSSQPFADNTPDEFTVVKSAEFFKESEVDTTITTRPTYFEEVKETSLGRIGVAITGAQIFNDYEDFERTITALDDNVIHDHVPFVDDCNGHTLVDGTDYHYHGIPACITDEVDAPGLHSTMISVLEDGFPVYSNQGEGGVEMKNADLDECSGHSGPTPEFSQGIYHYHLTSDEAPYMIDCYHG